MGVKNTVMLTGDNARVARAVSRRLGLRQYVADVLPAQKAEFVQDLRRRGTWWRWSATASTIRRRCPSPTSALR